MCITITYEWNERIVCDYAVTCFFQRKPIDLADNCMLSVYKKKDLMSMNYEILNDASHCMNWIIEIYQCLEIDDGCSMHVAHRSLLKAH